MLNLLPEVNTLPGFAAINLVKMEIFLKLSPDHEKLKLVSLNPKLSLLRSSNLVLINYPA